MRRSALILLLAALSACGCQQQRQAVQNRPYLFGGAAPAAAGQQAVASAPGTAPPAVAVRPSAPPAAVASAPPAAAPIAPSYAEAVDPRRVDELERKGSQLEQNNQDLHRRLAEAQQQGQILQEQVGLLRERLEETATHLRTAQQARGEADRRVEAMLASTRQRGATITANNSLRQPLAMVQIADLDVRQDGDVIRIAIPADRLFRPGGVEWADGAGLLLQQVAVAIGQNYPRQLVAIEGHTDTAVIGLPGGNQQLAASQSLAVYQHLTTVAQLPERQLFTMALGPSHPRASNATDEGRAANRRIELVIYPEEAK